MEISLAASTFTQALARLAPIAKGAVANLPILADVAVTFADNTASFAATDLELSALTWTVLPEAKALPRRTICFPAAPVLAVLKQMGEPVWISVPDLDAVAQVLIVHNAECSYTFPVIDPRDFPEVKPLDGKGGCTNFVVNGTPLRAAIEKVLYAVSRDDSRFQLTGVYLKLAQNVLYAVATDGFREAVCPMAVEWAGTAPGVIVPRRSVEYLLGLIEDGKVISITAGDTQIEFNLGDTQIISRLITGNFPEWENIIPVNEYTCIVKRKPLLLALRRCLTVCDRNAHNAVTVTFGPLVTLTVEGQTAQGDETIPDAEWSGDPDSPLPYAINAKYLIDAVSRIDSPDITFAVPAEYRPIVIAAGDYKQIIMPIRT